ncbi:MAG: hypothetical protein AB2L20_14975 [Mangrovibacterium sp.]
MKTLSEKQPWGYLICAGVKDIENRTWPLPKKMKGQRVLIHTSGNAGKKHFNINLTDDQMKAAFPVLARKAMDWNSFKFGAIIGSVEIVDCVINHPSIWAEKTETKVVGHTAYYDANNAIWNWVLANPVLFKEPILNVKGRLGFWDYPLDFCHICGQPALGICQKCDEIYCEDHAASYDQFSHIDYDCCSECKEAMKNI